MKNYILRVRTKSVIKELEKFCNVIYDSKVLNIVGIEIVENNVDKLNSLPEIESYQEAEEGEFLFEPS